MGESNSIQSFAATSLKVRSSRSGVHLFDRSSGLNVLLDEVEVPSSSWAAAPRQVSIALTNACDLECLYCYAPKYRASLSVESIKSWLHELDTNGCLSIGFGGGEPTLHPHFVALCRFATQETQLAVTFTTHAHHINADFADRLTGNVHFVRVSMDGVGKTYEALRGRSFSTFCDHLTLIRRSIPFGINFVVNEQTLPDLDTATALAIEWGAKEFLLLPEQPVKEQVGIDEKTIQALRYWVSQYQGSVPLTISEAGADGLPICNPLQGETGLDTYAHIDASGVLKSSSYESSGVPIGTNGVMEALSMLRKERNSIQ